MTGGREAARQSNPGHRTLVDAGGYYFDGAVVMAQRGEVAGRKTNDVCYGTESIVSIPFKGVVNIDIQDSTPDWAPYAPADGPPEGAPSVLYVVLDDVGFSAMEPFGGADRDAEHQADRRQGAHVHELPHDGAVLADAVVPADGPQPHDERDGLHHRGVVGVPERERAHPV